MSDYPEQRQQFYEQQLSRYELVRCAMQLASLNPFSKQLKSVSLKNGLCSINIMKLHLKQEAHHAN
jgi:hypothetical protein